ncbi:MAG: peptide ABC transporter substrate-binding protein [Patescibacteria group bacterium]
MASLKERVRSAFKSITQSELTPSDAPLVFAPTAKRKIPTWAQMKYLPRLLSPRDKTIVNLALAVFVICLAVAAIHFIWRNTELVADYGGTYTEGLVGAPQYINPILAPSNDVDQDISRLVYSRLFTYNSSGELVGDLVTNYTLSEDQKTYTFFLRPEVKFHDGDNLTVDDVLFTVSAIQNSEFKSPLRGSLAGVAVTKLDDSSFSMTLSEPFSPFLTSLTFGIMPEHLWFDVQPATMQLSELNLTPIGSGPFSFDRLVKDRAGNVKEIELTRNEEYYAEQPYLDRVKFIFYPDTVSAVTALEDKRIDGLAFVPRDDKESLSKENKRVRFYALRLPQYTAVFFNTKKSTVLKDQAVRTALAWGVDHNRIIQDVLLGDGESIYTPILPGYLGHNAEVDKKGFDIEKGKQLLDEAGWKLPEGEEYRKDGDTLLEFTIATVNLPEYQQTLAILQESWKAMGVKVNVDIYAPEDIQIKVINPREYEALLFGEIVGTDPDPYPFWHSSQTKHPGLNLAIFFDKDVDSLLTEARKTNDQEQRRLKYLHFQNILAEMVPAIFLYNPTYTYSIDKRVRGVGEAYITVPADRFRDIGLWHIETKRKWKQKIEEAEAATGTTAESTDTVTETTETTETTNAETTTESTDTNINQ